jgi:heptosyltransferase-2
MRPARHYLVVKHGALGDVVRTSYFAAALKRRHGHDVRLSWLTSPPAVPLLRFNPWIDDVWTSFDEAASCPFDVVFSLDDDLPVLEGVGRLRAACVRGAFLDRAGRPTYSEDARRWFDMGLLSRFGKAHADRLKKANRLGHAQMFCSIFGVESVQPGFHGDPPCARWAEQWLGNDQWHVGITPFAGARWPGKALHAPALATLIAGLLDTGPGAPRPPGVVLIGAGGDRERNLEIAARFDPTRVRVAHTDDSVLRLAALVGHLDYLIASDSLAMHLAIAQRVPFLAFFGPTSAPEIDDFGLGRKVLSLSDDYCSYRPDADSSSITGNRLLDAFHAHLSALTPGFRSPAPMPVRPAADGWPAQ